MLSRELGEENLPGRSAASVATGKSSKMSLEDVP